MSSRLVKICGCFILASSTILAVLRLSAAFENNYGGAHSGAALIRGRRSFGGGAHSGAAPNRGRRPIGGGAQTGKYGTCAFIGFQIGK